MANPTLEGTITLRVVVEGNDPYRKSFSITVPLHEVYWEVEQISIYGLDLYKANLPFEWVGHARLLDNAFLWVNRCVASEWLLSLDVDWGLVASRDLYPEETKNPQARDAITLSSLCHLIGDVLQKNTRDDVEAGGMIIGPGSSYLATIGMKNEIGMGSSDLSIQAAQS
ncbi:hypothetical protein B0J17DRAFT_629808 [Rhizoctonia solani]|nr:hypothetical protein B0J17DRAFT_629808 [Rhizoctonia solani]